jgi:hypothetical protein
MSDQYGDDCLSLLIYVSKNRGKAQSVRGLAIQTNIPRKTLELILREAQFAQLQNGDSVLHLVAQKHRYDFWVFHHGHEAYQAKDRRRKVQFWNRQGLIIDAVYGGPVHYQDAEVRRFIHS